MIDQSKPMRVCHARAIIDLRDAEPELDRKPEFVNDRSRFVMSAVSEKAAGGKMRPQWRHELLSKKQAEFTEVSVVRKAQST
jgi:indolepyruvate ferredoxin oxidoreductase alpha subunit